MTAEVGSDELARMTAAPRDADLLLQLSVEILGLLNENLAFPDTIQRVVAAIKRRTGFDAVGIRLRHGEDFPYSAQDGFSNEFLLTENTLHGRAKDADICRDERGLPRLECTCGLVLSGQTDPTSSLFTAGGSCLVNRGWDSPGFPGAHNDPRHNPRNRCLHDGFNSVALVPIRAHQRIIGLLQLNDHRLDRFTLESVQFFEGLCAGIGLALMRKQAEEALLTNKAKLELALTSSNMGTWQWDVVTDKRSFDVRTCTLLGIDPTTFGGTAEEFFAAVHPSDREAVKLALRRTLEENPFYETEYRTVWHDGSIHYVSARGRCVRDDAGQPLSINGVVWDTSEQRQMQAALRRSEVMQRAMIANISDAISVIDGNGNNLFKSSSAEKWFGWLPEDVAGTPLWDRVHTEDLERIQAAFKAVVAENGATQTGECRYRCKDGSYKWIEYTATNLLGDPDIAGVLLNYHDITERKQAEEAAREKHAELERFTYSVSHDLKSPLVTIETFLAYLEQDLERNDAVNVAKDFGFIRNAASKMSLLLDELLRLSRVGRMTNPSAEVPLLAVVNEALNLVAGRFAARSVAVEITDQPVLLYGDRQRLVELFQNLLDNAAKFMGEQSTPRVEVGVESAEDGILLYVRDNGIGFEQLHSDRLFGLFERLDPNTEGTGLGLALAKRIVQVHGGKIWSVSDGSGTGATFKFTLAHTRLAKHREGT